jgi:hypothetical protein
MVYRDMMNDSRFSRLSNEALLAEVKRLAANERQATARLVASLMELDTRRLYLGEGCASMFTYCTQVLHLSEHAAYGRIEAARAAHQFPVILDLLTDGSLTLTAVGLLRPHLTDDNYREILSSARGKSKREVEVLVAGIRPRPDVPPSVRKLPEPRHTALLVTQPESALEGGASSLSVQGRPPIPPNRNVVAPLTPENYKVQFTIRSETRELLGRVQDLLRHQVPNGDLAEIFDRALRVLLAELERTKLATTERPRTPRSSHQRSRHIPAHVKRVVWARDGERCAFVGAHGRCTETGLLQLHHVVPYAAGGESVTENIQVRCASHNRYEAERYFGGGNEGPIEDSSTPDERQLPLLVRETREPWGVQLGPDLVSCPSGS